MRQRTLIIFAVGMVTVIVMSLLIWNQLNPQIPSKFEKNINRNTDNQEEETALTVAESINYSAITTLERFDGSSDPQAYLQPSPYLAYTYARFIDTEVIEYYETRYDNLQGKLDPKYPKQIELIYQANVSKRTEFRVFNSPAPEGVTWHNTTVVTSAPDNSLTRRDSAQMQFFYKNQSAYQMVEWEYDFNFSDCYVVEMGLQYSEIYAPTAGFWSDVYQIIVLDQEFMPVLIGFDLRGAIA